MPGCLAGKPLGQGRRRDGDMEGVGEPAGAGWSPMCSRQPPSLDESAARWGRPRARTGPSDRETQRRCGEPLLLIARPVLKR